MAGIIYLFVAIIFIARLMSAINKAGGKAKTNTYTNQTTYQPSNQRYVSSSDISGASVESMIRDVNTSGATHLSTSQSTTAKAPNTYVSKKNSVEEDSNSKKNATAKSTAKAKTETVKTTEKKKSTTEILNEKAKEDQIQHHIEKVNHEREERRIHGNLRYAKRHYPGDAIPNGYREVICDYCNAENLVPAHDYSTKYNCYFCREII